MKQSIDHEHLPGRPVITTQGVVNALPTTSPTAGKAIAVLEAAGILVEVTAKDVAADIADVETDDAHEHADDHDHHAEAAEAKGIEHLVLNDGEKWPMDEHTRKLAGEMNETVDNAKVESAEDGQKVGETLNAQLATLVEGCTMTGPAHDNLHVFLGAFMPVVNALEADESDDVAQERYNEAKSLLETYNKHFE